MIDADALKQIMFYHEIDDKWYADERIVDAMPTIDAVETKHGVWNPISHSDVCTCSVCGDYIDNAKYYRYNYCPNCGAEMSFDEV